MLRIYNSLTQMKEDFIPIEKNKVKMYVCGPTVYDYIHIGNARSFTAFDTVVRYLRYRDFDVTYVRNITDIDDKIINRANENKEDFRVVVERFSAAFREDLNQLGLLVPDHEPRATDHIASIIDIIQKLIVNNYAYVASNGDVYYDVRRFEKYGCLSHRNIDELESGSRVEILDAKHDPLDFVLWKLAKPGEPHWESPWGVGRPGWHIECSAMSNTLLGKHFDIHGGGKDLIFPHHENEIAQSEGASKHVFVNTWMHAGYLQIDKEKMSKSLGNFMTLRELLKSHSPEVIRFFLISGHYRSPLQYTEGVFQQAHSALTRLYTALRDFATVDYVPDSLFEKQFMDAMDDDFNTPIALSVLFELAHATQRLREKDRPMAERHAAQLKHLGGVLGILQEDPESFLKGSAGDLDVAKIESLIMARNAARASKDWAGADLVRQELTSMGVVLEDGASGTTTWKRTVK